MHELPAPTTRARHGRWLGGVCAGLAAPLGRPARARALRASCSARCCSGSACSPTWRRWLILPSEGEDGATAGQRGIVALAQLTGALIALAMLAFAGAVATVFGYGGVIAGVAGVVLLARSWAGARLGPAWALLPIGALTVPSVALAVGGVHLDPSASPERVTPRVHAARQGVQERARAAHLRPAPDAAAGVRDDPRSRSTPACAGRWSRSRTTAACTCRSTSTTCRSCCGPARCWRAAATSTRRARPCSAASTSQQSAPRDRPARRS